MNLDTLKSFFFWWMIVDIGIYLVTVIAVLFFPDSIYVLHSQIFTIDESTSRNAIYNYMAMHKLFINVFNFAPWIALVIITKKANK